MFRHFPNKEAIWQAVVKQYATRLNNLIENGKARGELAPDLDNDAAATLFIGTIQGLIMQSLMSGDMDKMRADAPRVFAIYERGIATFYMTGQEE